MKKIFLIGCVCFLSISMIGCGGKKMGGVIKGEKTVTEGWIDNETFQVIAWGEASPGVTGAAVWRNQAKEGAQMMAEKRIIEKFKGYALEASGYTEAGGNTEVIVSKYVAGAARGGEIVSVTFDESSKACEIVYRVHGKDLKKKVKEGFQVSEIEPSGIPEE